MLCVRPLATFSLARAFFLATCIPTAVLAAGPASSTEQATATLPLAFEANQGQADPSVRFLARGPGYRVFLAHKEAVIVLGGGAAGRGQLQGEMVMRMRFEGASPATDVQGEDLMELQTNYFVGGDQPVARTGIPSHRKVRYSAIYPGIDLVYYGNGQQLEYDLQVAPKADPEQIKVRFEGSESARISDSGDLHLATPLGDIVYRKPVAYQQSAGRKEPVAAQYAIASTGEVGFRLGSYDRNRPLVIDPILAYSSYMWSSATAMAADPAGNVYLGGYTSGSDLPASTGYQTRRAGDLDAYVVKLDPTGKKAIWATYLGARGLSTQGTAIAVDAGGNAYIAGTTSGAAYPVTPGAYQTTWSAGSSFVTKLNANGNALVYSTFLNGATVKAVTLDAVGNLYLTGPATAILTTPGAFQATRPNASGASPFVAKLNSSGTAMAYATYLGGFAADLSNGIAVDAGGNAYVAGTAVSFNFPRTTGAFQTSLRGSSDGFVAKLNATGAGLEYSTLLGGTRDESGRGIAVDAAGQAFVVGRTYSDDFPITSGVFQPSKGYAGDVANGYIAKLNAGGTGLVFGSFLGGAACIGYGNYTSCETGGDGDGLTAVAVDAWGYAYVGGHSSSARFPQVDAIQAEPVYYSKYTLDTFLAKIKPDAKGVVYAVVLGGRMLDAEVDNIAPDPAGGVFALVTGSDLPYTAGLYSPDYTGGALVKLEPGKYPTKLTTSANPAGRAQGVTLTAEVQNPKQGGSVTFYSGTTPLGSAAVVGGAATLTINLPPGIHKITGVYSEDGKPSPVLFQKVNGQ